MKRLLFVVLLIGTGVLSAAEIPPVQKLLPAANAVKGFKLVPGSLIYAKGDDLSKIYDGGYELYTKNGVIDAARQMYQREKDYVEVTMHTMKSDKAAADFLSYWLKENKVKSASKSSGTTFFVVTKPNVTLYFVKRRYFGTVAAFYAEERAKKDVASFRDAISKLIVSR
ncbi:MAG: hypothetical protein QHI38_05955 [Armatimonadota bacterium]|nr:hypothetical protein [Armatimonadota bacterium]